MRKNILTCDRCDADYSKLWYSTDDDCDKCKNKLKDLWTPSIESGEQFSQESGVLQTYTYDLTCELDKNLTILNLQNTRLTNLSDNCKLNYDNLDISEHNMSPYRLIYKPIEITQLL